MIGIVVECGLVKIFRNVVKCASGISSGDFDELAVDGTLRMSFENCASAWSFVVRYLTSSHACVAVLAGLRDADDRAVDVAGAVELGMRVVDRHRRRAVLQLRVLVLDERRRATRRRASSRACRSRTRARRRTRRRRPSASGRACCSRRSRSGSSASVSSFAQPGSRGEVRLAGLVEVRRADQRLDRTSPMPAPPW